MKKNIRSATEMQDIDPEITAIDVDLGAQTPIQEIAELFAYLSFMQRDSLRHIVRAMAARSSVW